MEEFDRHVQMSEVESVWVTGPSLRARLDSPTRSGVFQVDLEGLEMQALMRRVAARGVAFEPVGRGRVRVQPTNASSEEAVEVDVLALTSADGEGCDPCVSDRTLRLPTGWYDVRNVAPEGWSVDSIEMVAPSGEYAAEALGPGGNTRVYVPRRTVLELRIVVRGP